MTPEQHSYATDTTSRLAGLLDQFTPGCDPDFDDPECDLACEFAELRLTLNHR